MPLGDMTNLHEKIARRTAARYHANSSEPVSGRDSEGETPAVDEKPHAAEQVPPLTEEQAERLRAIVWEGIQTQPLDQGAFLGEEEQEALETLLGVQGKRGSRPADKAKDAREELLRAAQATGVDLDPLGVDEAILRLRLDDGRCFVVYVLPFGH